MGGRNWWQNCHSCLKKQQATSRRLGQCGTIVQRANLLTTLLGVIEAQLKSKRETATHQPTFRRRTGT